MTDSPSDAENTESESAVSKDAGSQAPPRLAPDRPSSAPALPPPLAAAPAEPVAPPADQATPAPLATGGLVSGPAFEVGTWGGMPRYQCRQCPYDTLRAEEMTAHLLTHAAPPAPAAVVEPVYDRFGNAVAPSAPAPEGEA